MPFIIMIYPCLSYCQAISPQFVPILASTLIGTDSFTADSMMSVAHCTNWGAWGASTSNISSSCIWSSQNQGKLVSYWPILIMAAFSIPWAVDWMGILMACLSPAPRYRFTGHSISGM